ncbi:MAG: UbiA family prenyltransferase [Verrucomicrobia bacterium]|nr:UbiA family prenyltransferase [Verrucomicrobiota bacterium]
MNLKPLADGPGTAVPTRQDARHGWPQLLRLPNLLTVPGDPLAGFLLSTCENGQSLMAACFAMGASLCFYAGGLLINDLTDFDTDCAERPDRPLPSGRVRKKSALAVAVGLMMLGGVLCAGLGPGGWLIGGMLVAAILAYDLKVKTIAFAGPLNMGICRGLSLFLGASAAPFTATVVCAGATLALYIAAVTHIARRETEARLIGRERWMPVMAVGMGLACFTLTGSQCSLMERMGFVVASGFTMGNAWMAGAKLKNDAPPPAGVMRAVGLWISALLLLQASFSLGSSAGRNGMNAGLALIALWPVNRFLSRRFHAS